ncbi:Digestive organ expansion factor [Phytophthora cinnamomi]|uniref:Digestive organ expansion factor n=1 Tax=Phytophthora cinnamomi TaxID=4785 RepID=UPI003559C130|nr:Digestive organ expansion factor [Phytophthora cinnamomi]
MMGQWKAQKIAQRSKERQFVASVDDKKRWQREQYHDTWERTANAIYKDESDEEAAEERAEEQEAAMTSDSDSDSDGDDALGGKKKNSLFDEFVNTFKPAEVEEEGEEEEEEEEEYEEVLVDENREEIEEEDDGEEEKEEEAVEAEQDGEEQEDEEQVAAMEKDDEELVENEEEKEEQEDPYRRRYLLSSFAEQDARKFDAQARKFAKVRLPELEEDVAYDVTYRSGVGADTQRMGSLERTLSQQMSAYTDVFFAGQTYENTATLRQLSAMHVLNHVLKARDTVTRNNERIKKRLRQGGEPG